MCMRRAFVEGGRLAHRLSARPPPSILHRSVLPSLHVARLSHSVTNPSLSRSQYAALQTALRDFHSAVTKSSLPIHASYEALQPHLAAIPVGRDLKQCDLQQLRDSIVRLAERPHDIPHDIISDLLQHLARMHDTNVDEYAKRVYYGLLYNNRLDESFRWLVTSTSLDNLTYARSPGAWHLLLVEVSKTGSVARVVEILQRMGSLRVSCRPKTATAVFMELSQPSLTPSGQRLRRIIPPSIDALRSLIKGFSSARFAYDVQTLKLIKDAYKSLGRPNDALEAEIMYISHLGNPDVVSVKQLNRVLSAVLRRRGRRATVLVYDRLSGIGIQPTDDTFAAVLGDSDRLADLRYWEQRLKMKAPPFVIESIMERRAAGSASPLEIYTHARSTGQLTGKMLHFAVKPLLTAHGLLKPSVRMIDKALELYRDFVSGLEPRNPPDESMESNQPDVPSERGQLEVSSENDQRDASRDQASAPADQHQGDSQDDVQSLPAEATVREPNPYPIPGTYQLFLRALTAVDNIPKYLPIAASLLEDMRKFRVHLDPQTASSFLILLMNTSRTPEEALSMYRLIARPDDPSKWAHFNEEAYVATLDAFCKLPTWPDGIPSVQLYFGIIADMRKRGLPLGPKVYTIILGQMARLATAATEVDDASARAAIAQAIAAVHNHLTVNPSFTPDTALWNQLMDAYQRAGCFPEAFRIWQTLFASGTFNAASVSVVLDACAYARAYDSAVRVYGALSAVGFPMNVKNWNTYLECLCRLGRLDEAMKVLCLEMTGREDVEPDKESARILLKFAINANREGEVRTRLRRFLPKLYYSLNSEK